LKPPPFEYRRAGSISEALALLEEHGDEAKPLAGGQSLVPMLSFRLARPSVLVDINRLDELADIRTTSTGVTVGALVRERAAERSEIVSERIPLLAAALPLIGHEAIRTRGTIGGSLSHADPAAELPAVAIATEAELVVQSAARGVRTIAADDFFVSFFTTAMEPDELLTEIRFPELLPGTGVAIEEVARRHGDFAIVGVVANVHLNDGVIDKARIVLTGVGETPARATAAESALIGATAQSGTYAEVAALAAGDLEPQADLHATTAYRRHVAGVLVRRALQRAVEQAEGGGGA
jgi:aerobic carbon-monoxide dehydrogenase medium subunit